MATLVETDPKQRLANFQYAAPEQRVPNGKVSQATDVYALGLILNEMFTGMVPHGTEYKTIGTISGQFGYLDKIVETMLRQSQHERPQSIAEIKTLLQRHGTEAIAMQRLSAIEGTVVKANEIDDPLALEPPKLIGADWNEGILYLTLDCPVNRNWIGALQNMSYRTAVLGKGPETFSFRNNIASVQAQEHQVQPIIDYFKAWLPLATSTLKANLGAQAAREEAERREQLRREGEAEERRLRVVRNIRI